MNTKDWFHTRKKYTVPLVLLAMLLVMAFLTIGVPYLLSIQQGDVSQAQVSVSLGVWRAASYIVRFIICLIV